MVSAPKTIATAEFSRDMVETLHKYFEEFEVEGVVKIDVTDKGLWLQERLTDRQKFLGSVKVIQQAPHVI